MSMIELNHDRVRRHYTSFSSFRCLTSKFPLTIYWRQSQQGFGWYLANCKVFILEQFSLFKYYIKLMTANYRYLGKNVPSVWQLTCFNISKESLILCKEKQCILVYPSQKHMSQGIIMAAYMKHQQPRQQVPKQLGRAFSKVTCELLCPRQPLLLLPKPRPPPPPAAASLEYPAPL